MRRGEVGRGERRFVGALLVVPLFVVPLLACPGPPEDPPPEDRPPEDRPAEAPADCLRGEPFVADGPVPPPGEPGPLAVDVEESAPAASGMRDAHRVSGLRWEAHEGCERFVIDLVAEEEEPATSAGRVRAEVLRDLGVVRISLRDVEWVDREATDATFDGPLARGAYAVWSPEGRWVYVDLHLADAAEAHVALLEDPARVAVDLRPGGGPVPEPAPRARHVVVLDPRPGSAEYPLTVTGYARTFEANVVGRLEREGETVADTFTTATAWVDAWGHYSLTLPGGPTGAVTLQVGDYSAKDGTWEGAAVELEMR